MNCRVCNNQNGSKHSYYGANSVCTSCRGFFMRSVQSGLYSAFTAHSSEGCKIDSKNRKSCKKCRFDKCLAVGMKISYVKTFNERKDCIQHTHKLLQVGFTSDEGKYLDELSSQYAYTSNLKSFQLYANAMELFFAHFISRPGYVLTADDINDCNQMDQAILVDTSLALLAFDSKVSNSDTFVLAKHNYHRLQSFYLGISIDADVSQFYEEFLEFGKQQRQYSEDIDFVMSHVDALSLNSEGTPNLSYEAIFSSPWAAHSDYEKEHRRIMKGIREWFWGLSNSPYDCDKNILVLVFLVLLHCTDGIRSELKDEETIEKVQAQYANLLQKYLAEKCKSKAFPPHVQFSKALMLCHDTSRAFELSQKRLQL